MARSQPIKKDEAAEKAAADAAAKAEAEKAAADAAAKAEAEKAAADAENKQKDESQDNSDLVEVELLFPAYIGGKLKTGTVSVSQEILDDLVKAKAVVIEQ